MQLTVKFTDVYDGVEYPRTSSISVPDPSGDIDEWADEYLRPMTGIRNMPHDESGYFAEIVECPGRPDLVGREFDWGI
ncbi:hypothetical protein [Mycobacteroides abscessus]|uniref:hypothetical protein n=1 Tax=Mycobacteroides abscessus TaxID=36809 RepID=UPI0005E5D5ED|nr:hypothetical protein [Mycobacteroides abscessus]CPW71915.1 Uncharacterised protein [Mycobacteroides abscessus]SKF62146.1 Uncharacterised protein [Mycobacteroides abscessus subsp. bolletii]SKH91355.1 Uncharacterised protein [Mycobacteroides abscessus subsp. bolletii]